MTLLLTWRLAVVDRSTRYAGHRGTRGATNKRKHVGRAVRPSEGSFPKKRNLAPCLMLTIRDYARWNPRRKPSPFVTVEAL